MTHESAKLAKVNAAKLATDAEQDAYLRGFDRGFNCASWQDLPEIGSVVRTDADGKVTVDESNQWDVVQSLAFEGESSDRDFSPFEFTASDFNESDDSEQLWEAFDSGIADGIGANIRERMKTAA